MSVEILREVYRTQTAKLKRLYPPELANYWNVKVTEAFPEVSVIGWEEIIPAMTNEPKDRHVLAAATGQAKNALLLS